MKRFLSLVLILAMILSLSPMTSISASADSQVFILPAGLQEERFDLALAFKLLPLLETQRTGAAVETLSAFNADWIAVSFPTRTLGGRNVGMAEHYGEWMEAHVPEDRVIAGRFEMDNELVYILRGAAAL